MLAHCCYRLIKNGEVIHSKLDSSKQTIIGMPDGYMHVDLMNICEYNPFSYVDKEIDFPTMCESILLSNSEHAVVIEVDCIGYRVLCWDGTLKFMHSATDTRDSSVDSYLPHPELFKSIGYRVTKAVQYRASSGVYRMTASKDNSKIYTNEGIFIPEFDISELSTPSYNYKGYKECVEKGYFGVVYYGDEHRFVDVADNNKLILI